jgi:hypothetical protein
MVPFPELAHPVVSAPGNAEPIPSLLIFNL